DEPAYDAATYEANPPRNYFVFEREGGAFSVLATEDLPTALLPPEARQALAARADERPWRERALAGFLSWLQANAALVGIFVVELWLAWLRGAAEAADRQVRLALGLDADLPAAYLGVAQWGAVVLALGLSVVVVFLGVVAQHGLHVAGRGVAGLRQGAGPRRRPPRRVPGRGAVGRGRAGAGPERRGGVPGRGRAARGARGRSRVRGPAPGRRDRRPGGLHPGRVRQRAAAGVDRLGHRHRALRPEGAERPHAPVGAEHHGHRPGAAEAPERRHARLGVPRHPGGHVRAVPLPRLRAGVRVAGRPGASPAP